MKKKDIQSNIWRNAFNDLDENGDPIAQPRKIKSDTSVAISRNNKISWRNPEIRQRRSEGIQKTKIENGCLSKEEKHKIYLETFQKDRKNGKLYIKLAKKYNVSVNFIQHIATNINKTVTDEQHQKNLEEWEENFGIFGEWELSSPGKDLIKDYDKIWKDNKVPPSAIYHIRFVMKDPTPEKIRNYLLPWTDNEILRHKNGKVANGRYINYRTKQYPFLTDKKSQKFKFKKLADFHLFLEKMYGHTIDKMYVHQILQQNEIRMTGPMTGWRFKKIK